MQKELPATDPVLKQALAGRSPEAAAKEMVSASAIVTGDQRKALGDGVRRRPRRPADPFIALARVIDPLERAMTKEVSALNDREAADNERIARAFLAVYGGSMSPDATFSLRISDGEVKRYPMNGTLAAPFTTFYGLYDREASFGGVPPFDLPPRWKAAKDSIDLALQFNGVSTGGHHRRQLGQSGHQPGCRGGGPDLRRQHGDAAQSVPVHRTGSPLGVGGLPRDRRVAAEGVWGEGPRGRIAAVSSEMGFLAASGSTDRPWRDAVWNE